MQPAYGTKKWATSRVSAFRDGIPAPDKSGIVTPPPPQHYSVQWNETDLAYLTRRFEEDGLFYWFSHEEGKHKLHVADSAAGWLGPSPSAKGETKVRLAQGSSDRNHINEWARRFSYVPGQRAGADWNFETPRMVPGTMTPSLVQMPEAIKRELYEYPARISTVAEAGREEIYLHAQKDQRLNVENSRSKRIDNNQAESVGHNKTIEVGNNHHEVIGGNMTLMVGPNILQKGVTAAMGVLRSAVGDVLTNKLGSFTDKLGFLSDLTMGEGNMIIGVGKNKAETVMVSSTEIVGAAKATTVGGGYQLTVGGVENESVAVGSWEEVGQTKVTVVGHKYEIVCGKSRILMERDGTITLEGVKLLINEQERMTVKAGKIELN